MNTKAIRLFNTKRRVFNIKKIKAKNLDADDPIVTLEYAA